MSPITLTTLIDAQAVVLPNGSRVFGPVLIGQGVGNIEIVLTTASWDPGTSLDVVVDLSQDNGQNFTENSRDMGVTPPPIKPGFPTDAIFTWSLEQEQSTTRRLRVTTTVHNGPLSTAITVRARAAS